MSQYLTSALLWFSAVGCGLLAGVYFAFSAFVMAALGRVDPAAGIAAMNAINVVITRSLFMPFFLGTTLTAAALAVLALFRWGEPGAIAMLTGGVILACSSSRLPSMCRSTRRWRPSIRPPRRLQISGRAFFRTGHSGTTSGRSRRPQR